MRRLVVQLAGWLVSGGSHRRSEYWRRTSVLSPTTNDRADDSDQAAIIERLVQMAFEARALGSSMVVATGEARHGDDGWGGDVRPVMERTDEFVPVHAWHPQIAEHDVGLCDRDHLQGLDPIARHEDVGAEALENQSRGFARILHVFDDQDAKAVELLTEIIPRGRGGRYGLGGLGRERKANRDRGALSKAVTGDGDLAALDLGQSLDEGQADAQSFVPPPRPEFLLTKDVKHEWQELPRDAFARVSNGHDGRSANCGEPHGDAAARVRELEGIREDVSENLLQSIGISTHQNRFARVDDVDGDLFLFRLVEKGVDRRTHRFVQV